MQLSRKLGYKVLPALGNEAPAFADFDYSQLSFE